MTDFIIDRIAPLVILIVGLTPLAIAIATTQADTITLEPCPTEDSANCYWDASEHGNGTGTDFIDLGGTTYTPKE